MESFRKLPFVFAIVLICLAVLVQFAGACIGMGLAALGVFDLFVILTVSLIAAPLIVGNQVVGRTQGMITLVSAVMILILSFAMLLLAIFILYKMIAYLSPVLPYIGTYANFGKGYSSGILAASLALKMGFVICMIWAQQKFLENIGLVIIVGMSLGLTLLVMFAHGFPRIMVSITDDLVAIVILIITCLRAFGFAVAAFAAIKKATGI